MSFSPLQQKIGRVAGNLVLAGFFSRFLYRNLNAFVLFGSVSALLIAAAETILVVMFICRGRAQTFSRRPSDWIIAFATTALPALLRPDHYSGLWQGKVLAILGAALLAFAYASLGTSISIAPALRDIRKGGMYAFVRHPIYASYIVLYGGYYVSYPTFLNLVVLIYFFTLMVLRTLREEKFLLQDSVYREYFSSVPWRFIPFVY